jgi:hypothetical protein
LYSKSKTDNPKKKKSGQKHKLARKIRTGIPQREKLKVNRDPHK